jgi:hypothetical protein
MSAAGFVIPLVGLVFPILLILAAIVFDVLVILWVAYGMWHDEWSVDLWRLVRSAAHTLHLAPVRTR